MRGPGSRGTRCRDRPGPGADSHGGGRPEEVPDQRPYNTIAGNGQSELPLFRLGYSEKKEIAGDETFTVMELHYVTSIVPGDTAAALDLSALENDEDL